MVAFGNLFTHYNYRFSQVETNNSETSLRIKVKTQDGSGDVNLQADLSSPEGFIPAGSPFSNEREARRFTGPLPYTFDYERETHSIIRIEGVRKEWHPRLIPVVVNRLSFLQQEGLSNTEPVLASCFYIEGIDYLWKRGVWEPLEKRESM